MSEEGRLQNYSVDQVAGAFVLCMGAIASLLLVIWQSKCHCKCNLCYLFQCERRPPSEDEMMGLQGQLKKRKQKKADEEEAMLGIKLPAGAEDTPDLLPPANSEIGDNEVGEIGDIEVGEVGDSEVGRVK